MRKILIISLALITSLSLVACGGDSTESTGESGSGSSEQSSSSVLPLEIIDSGYDITGSNGDYYIYYSVILKNSNEELGAELPSFRITAYDKDGSVLGTEDQTINSIYPNSELGYGGMGPSVEKKPDKVEFEVLDINDESWKSGDDFEYPNFKPLKAENAKIKDDGLGSSIVVGELENLNDYNLESVAVSILFKDKDGKLKGGDTTYVDNVKANGKTPFETLGYETDSKEYVIYTQPW